MGQARFLIPIKSPGAQGTGSNFSNGNDEWANTYTEYEAQVSANSGDGCTYSLVCISSDMWSFDMWNLPQNAEFRQLLNMGQSQIIEFLNAESVNPYGTLSWS